jgi:hypothetical protein
MDIERLIYYPLLSYLSLSAHLRSEDAAQLYSRAFCG